jgi:hypothetical protein
MEWPACAQSPQSLAAPGLHAWPTRKLPEGRTDIFEKSAFQISFRIEIIIFYTKLSLHFISLFFGENKKSLKTESTVRNQKERNLAFTIFSTGKAWGTAPPRTHPSALRGLPSLPRT